MTTQEAESAISTLYSRGKIDITKLINLTAALNKPSTQAQAIKSIEIKFKRLNKNVR